MIKKPPTNQSLTQQKIYAYQQARLTERALIAPDKLAAYDKETFDDVYAMSARLAVTMEKIAKRDASIAANKAIKEHEAWQADVYQPKIYMSDKLVVSVHGLDVHEKRLMALAVSKISLDFDSREPIKITQKEYESVFKYDHASKYGFRSLKSAAKSLFERKITWKDPALQEDFELHRWVSSVSYRSRNRQGANHTDEGAHVLLHVTQPIVEHLQKIDDAQYVIYNLLEFAKLETKYGQRLFELIKNFRRTGLLRMRVQDFCAVMEVPQSYLREDGFPNDFGNINNRVIKPAVRDIAKIFSVKVEPKRSSSSGTAFAYIDFKFKKELSESDERPTIKDLNAEVEAREKRITRKHKTRDRIRAAISAEKPAD